ncbi:MAG: hypothetical protein LBU99_05580, partial [Spirochaetaceae bacterium]|nr:hypothetical protein [Spirochaetaceae bacterium]
GKSSALTAPAITLEAANTHVNTTNEPHGATSAATAGRIIQRDANGRVQVANPLADADIANKGYVTGLMAGLSLQDVYSLSEVKTINVWADGKAIYRKGLLISSLPKAASASISFALTGVTGITNVLGIARNKTTGRVLTLPHPLINIKAALSSGNITGQIVTGADRTGWEAYVFVEYTK